MYNEADTRAKLIDPKLHAAGWDEERIKREHYFTKGQIYLVGDKARRKQPLKADYPLRYNAALPLAIVEAKEEGLAPAAGLQQAKTYAQQLGLLFAYSTNGHGIEEFDFSTQVQQSLTAFPSPEELYQRYSAANRSVTGGVAAETRPPYLDPLVVPYYTADGRQPRYYQEIAINKAVQAISRGQRRVLLTMATGTGKTYIALQIAWKLSRAGRARRILFLADRLVLRDQAYNAFAAFEDARAVIDEGKAPTRRDVYFAIYKALREQIEAAATGTSSSMKNISKDNVLRLRLPLPPLPEQRRIVAHLDGIRAKADLLVWLQAESATELDALPPAVLNRAFKGEL